MKSTLDIRPSGILEFFFLFNVVFLIMTEIIIHHIVLNNILEIRKIFYTTTYTTYMALNINIIQSVFIAGMKMIQHHIIQ